MTGTDAASIAAGLAIGYWLVSMFMRRSDGNAGIDMPSSKRGTEAEGKRPWYEVLEVPEWATEEEVAAAYRAKSAQYHPDKVATMGTEIRALAALKMSEINAARREASRRRA